MTYFGNLGSISDIDTPRNTKETTFALWYDVTRQKLLKLAMPNFALGRKTVAALVAAPPFGYERAFEYPADCLKVLGLGEVEDKDRYPYAVEGRVIYTNDNWDDGLALRFIKDYSDVGTMSPEFKIQLAIELAANVCLALTKDKAMQAKIQQMLPGALAEASALNAQENRPIRISTSRFRTARYATPRRNEEKS